MSPPRCCTWAKRNCCARHTPSSLAAARRRARSARRPALPFVLPTACPSQRSSWRRASSSARPRERARVCFIGGDPAPHIPLIIETLSVLSERRRIPAVFNSNFYLTSVALDLLDGAIDIYLPDLKFGPASGTQSCGERLGGMPDYWRSRYRLHRTGAQGRQASGRTPPADAGSLRLLHTSGAGVAGDAARRGSEPAHTVYCPAAGKRGIGG